MNGYMREYMRKHYAKHRDSENERNKNIYRRNKEAAYIKEHGSLEGYKGIRPKAKNKKYSK